MDAEIDGGVDQAGRRTLQLLITTWDAAGGGPFAASAIASTGLAKTAGVTEVAIVSTSGMSRSRRITSTSAARP